MITIHSILGEGFTMYQANKVLRAIEAGVAAWNNPSFGKRVLDASFSQTSDSSRDVWLNLTSNKNKIARIEINNTPNGSETAATNTVTGVISLQVVYLNKCSTEDLIETLFHELTHCPEQGAYKHSYLGWGPWKNRYWSVPYQFGRMVSQMAQEMKLV